MWASSNDNFGGRVFSCMHCKRWRRISKGFNEAGRSGITYCSTCSLFGRAHKCLSDVGRLTSLTRADHQYNFARLEWYLG